jgi:hypothetical protein
MEKLNDFLNNIKDRFSNPLVFSFLCAWLTINWPITVGLIWYDSTQISRTGCNSIFDFINGQINLCDSLIFPFIIALLYTFLMPIIKNIIRAFYSWSSKWGDKWNQKISKDTTIPFEKYLKFREDYDSRSKILEEVIIKESSSQLEHNQTKTELLEEKAKSNDISQKLTISNDFINQLYDYTILNGYWNNKYADSYNLDLNGEEDVFIDNGKYYIIEKFGKKVHAFNIKNFYFDNRNKVVFFVKERVNQDAVVLINNEDTFTRFNPNVLEMERKDLLTGWENGTTRIEYLKKDQTVSLAKDNNA